MDDHNRCINCDQRHESYWADPGGNVGPFCARCYHQIAAPLPASAALQDTRQLVQELTAALQERPDRERTHWAGCHTDPTHRDCAIARLLAALTRADQP